MAAPKGNTNGSGARIVRDQIKWCLENYSSSKIEQGQALRKICMNLVEKACEESDFAAIQTIFDRAEGKPTLAVSGDDLGPLQATISVSFIDSEN
jgi:hypothetical protein